MLLCECQQSATARTRSRSMLLLVLLLLLQVCVCVCVKKGTRGQTDFKLSKRLAGLAPTFLKGQKAHLNCSFFPIAVFSTSCYAGLNGSGERTICHFCVLLRNKVLDREDDVLFLNYVFLNLEDDKRLYFLIIPLSFSWLQPRVNQLLFALLHCLPVHKMQNSQDRSLGPILRWPVRSKFWR